MPLTALASWLRRIVPEAKPNPVLVVVEGPNDNEFLRRISAL